MCRYSPRKTSKKKKTTRMISIFRQTEAATYPYLSIARAGFCHHRSRSSRKFAEKNSYTLPAKGEARREAYNIVETGTPVPRRVCYMNLYWGRIGKGRERSLGNNRFRFDSTEPQRLNFVKIWRKPNFGTFFKLKKKVEHSFGQIFT